MVCYNRTRHKHLCDGQTEYAAKTIDDCVEGVLLEAFVKLKSIPNDGIIEQQFACKMKETEARINRIKKLMNSRTSELADLKGEVVKVIRGTSKWSMELLNEIITNTESEIKEFQDELEALKDEYESSETLYSKLQNQYRSFLDWANIFTESEIGAKKMIASHMIDKVSVSKGNHIEIDFNISFEQFLGDVEQTDLNATQVVV